MKIYSITRLFLNFIKTKTLFLISPFLLLGALMILIISCKKENVLLSPIQFNSDLTYGTMTDIDGNVYKTITIGTQTWMAENLKVTRYRNGDIIPYVADSSEWNNLTTGACCYYDNDEAISKTYGILYNWYCVADSRIIAPEGWHVPSDDDWMILTNFLGSENVAGRKLKEIGTFHWRNPNSGATNVTGFTALPGGVRQRDLSFTALGLYSGWWHSSEYLTKFARHTRLEWLNANASVFGDLKDSGYYLRCVKD